MKASLAALFVGCLAASSSFAFDIPTNPPPRAAFDIPTNPPPRTAFDIPTNPPPRAA
jgi:hypothetical protein